jgi:hypothetical protein
VESGWFHVVKQQWHLRMLLRLAEPVQEHSGKCRAAGELTASKQAVATIPNRKQLQARS